MKATVYIKLREAVLDPQGKAVEGVFKDLGVSGVRGVRVGKMIEMTLDDTSEGTADARLAAANAKVKDMCQRVLVNTVIEDYHFVIAQ
jgi:phosphoribosylformylglycinamidine synthase